MPAIEVRDLSKSFRTAKRREGLSGAVRDLFIREYQTVNAVAGINFAVEPGELVGFIGPNGAGKSTTIKMLTGILKPTAGEMSVLGYHPFNQRRTYTHHIGVVFGQRTQLWWDIAVIESLRLLGNIYRLTQTETDARVELLNEILDLKDLLHTPVRKLSLGQRIRCDLAASLIHSPRILFLDEPTIGLDAVVKVKVREFLRRINEQFKTTVILTTHDLYEIEELCERIVIIDKGRLIFDGDLEQIKELPGLTRRAQVDFSADVSSEDLTQVFDGKLSVLGIEARRAELEFDPQRLPAVELMRTIVDRFGVTDFSINEPNIEQVVMRIYQQGGIG